MGRLEQGQSVGTYRQELLDEMLIWRPIIAKVTTLAEVKNGTCSLLDLLKLNALLDGQAAAEAEAYKK